MSYPLCSLCLFVLILISLTALRSLSRPNTAFSLLLLVLIFWVRNVAYTLGWLQCPDITHVCYHAQVIQCYGSVSGLHTYWESIPPIEPHSLIFNKYFNYNYNNLSLSICILIISNNLSSFIFFFTFKEAWFFLIIQYLEIMVCALRLLTITKSINI